MKNTKEILKKVRKIEIKTRRLSNHIFSGEYHSSFKGRGMTFSEVRKYQFGDEVRAIDWNVTARYNEPYIKIFEEERELTMMLMVDVSGSEHFGTSSQFKEDTIVEIAATLAFSAIQNSDKVGLLLFSDQIELFIPPKKGKSHVLRIIRDLIEHKAQSTKTNIGEALKFLSSVLKKKAIVFLLSDFISDDYQQPLRIAAKKHDLTGIRIYDKHEASIPPMGVVPMKCAETGRVKLINTNSKSVRMNYEKQYQQEVLLFQKQFSTSGAGYCSVCMDESYVKALLAYFKNKGS
jgi:uncharacterized protein (DUF58 family)